MSNRQIDQLAIDRFRFEAEEAFARHGFRGQVEVLRARLNGLKVLRGEIRLSGFLDMKYKFVDNELEFTGIVRSKFMDRLDQMPIPAMIHVLGDLWQIYHYNVYVEDQ